MVFGNCCCCCKNLISNIFDLTEALLFFTPPEKAEDAENDGDYNDEQRKELRNIVKRKMKKSLQSALPRHAKANKKFRRFAKNL